MTIANLWIVLKSIDLLCKMHSVINRPMCTIYCSCIILSLLKWFENLAFHRNDMKFSIFSQKKRRFFSLQKSFFFFKIFFLPNHCKTLETSVFVAQKNGLEYIFDCIDRFIRRKTFEIETKTEKCWYEPCCH